ncbi:hypothetical protein GRS66_006858 [Saccharomyces pastorianus]|uniref:Uncharacterized protein n=1 Tax=Saccharomyces pastorianus TaxID=27292 RepID=A0A6C1E6L3_SACPS|nr:hypothetical protein GRS66_006858 [Saccharomyces pastorianus]
MIRNNVLNDIAGSARMNVKCKQQVKRKLGRVEAQGIGLGANEKPTSEEDFKHTSYEEKVDREKIKMHYLYKKGGTMTDIPKLVINQHADIRERESRKCTPEHNIGTTTSERELPLLEDVPQSIKQANRHFEDTRDWSQLSTSKICEILEDISSKKRRSRVHFSSLQKKENPHKRYLKKDDEGNQDWSQIANEDICELIEKIASRRNNSLKEIDRLCSQNQENSETIHLSENGTLIGEPTNTRQRNAKGSSENTTEKHSDLESKISRTVCLPYQEKELRLIPFLQRQRMEPAIISISGVREFRMRKFTKKLKPCPRSPVKEFFGVGIIISSQSLSSKHVIFLHQNSDLRFLRGILGRSRRSFLLSKLEQTRAEIGLSLIKPPQTTSPFFATIVLNIRLGSKAFAAICHYEPQAILFDSRGLKTRNCSTHSRFSRPLHIPYEATAIEEIDHLDLNSEDKTSQGNTVVKNERLFNDCLEKKSSADPLNSMKRLGKTQPLEAKNRLHQNVTINVQGSVTVNNSLFASLCGLFHSLCSKGYWNKVDLSETLFYDDLTNRWVKMGDLVQYH